jgi:hypothetical protein
MEYNLDFERIVLPSSARYFETRRKCFIDHYVVVAMGHRWKINPN